MPKAKPEITQIFRVKVTLIHTDPAIWRRIELPATLPLNQLHDVVQLVMGWDDSHLHHFYRPSPRNAQRIFYGVPNPDWDDGAVLPEHDYQLNQVISRARQKLLYEYDFGDSWEHELLIEKVLPPEPGVKYPRCIAGERSGPPEDCGGVWGYQELVRILADPADPEYADRIEWIGDEFDPAAFDLDGINQVLRKVKW